MPDEILDPIFTGYYGPKGARSQYKIVSCVLVNRDTGEVDSRGIAICAPTDQFCRQHGQSRAHIRAAGKAQLVWNETDSLIRNPEVMTGLFDAGFFVDWRDQSGNAVPCLPTLTKSEAGFKDQIVLTDRERSAVNAWRRRNGFFEGAATGRKRLTTDYPLT
jgi:hypothetical protein